MKISVEDRVQDLLVRFSVGTAVQDPFVRLFVQGVYMIGKISVQDLYKRSLGKISL